MLFQNPIDGSDLPDKTVCLTFDDGPGVPAEAGRGSRTLELGVHLANRGINASFFVIGENIARTGGLAWEIAGMRHNLANHTWSHPSLIKSNPAQAVKEIERADDLLRSIPGCLTLFRPPFGHWSGPLAESLNATSLQKYIGPIMWDIDGEDWRSWLYNHSAERCVGNYIRLLSALGRGVLLLHDSNAEQEIAARNQTYGVVKLLVAWLGANGFRILPLREAPQLRRAFAIRHLVSMSTYDNLWLRCDAADHAYVARDEPHCFGLSEVRPHEYALISSRGAEVRIAGHGGPVFATAGAMVDELSPPGGEAPKSVRLHLRGGSPVVRSMLQTEEKKAGPGLRENGELFAISLLSVPSVSQALGDNPARFSKP